METGLPYLDLADPGFSTRGAEVLAARDAHWCAETPYGLAVLRYREAGRILRDRRFRQGSHNWPDTVGIKGPFADFWRQSVIGQEGAAHQRMRALAVPALSEDYVRGLIPVFRRIARDLCDELRRADRCEFQSAFAEPFAGQAITTLLGMEREAWPLVAHNAADLGLAMGVEAPKYEARFNTACGTLFRLADQLVAKVRRGEDDGSYVARMVAAFDRNGDCSHEELLNTIVISIFGGVDTTRALIGLGLSLFIENPAQWRALRADAGLIPAAIEEFIRARPTTTWATREAVEDVEMNGRVIAKGTVLHLLVHAAARDPEICDDPAFDITARRRRHFGFGGGAHHCIGHFVARTDIAAALGALRETFATVEYDGAPEWLPDSGNTGAHRLPVRYTLVT
ncbi:cytochrome P450 [Roseovarius sp. SYSU LYC5161]|uniref:cytochrome P450 n=1 Tax=Roseovarius halophilus (ex Wu et al. 2025) TaxID=3376060 RepID=UPI002871ABB6|nr:cytochrome P450 [Roseovarius sp.]